jgi:pyruvate dehydrogenase E1 component alpha subunit
VQEWKKKDPLDRFTRKLLEDRTLTPGEAEKKRAQFTKEVEEAVQFAKEAPYPDPSEVTSDVFYQG